MNAAVAESPFPGEPVITREGRFFRVSLIRNGKVESYLCETEAEAKRWAALIVAPPSDAQRGPRRPPTAKPEARTEDRFLGLVRTNSLKWKPRP